MAREVFSEKKINCPSCRGFFNLRFPNPRLYAASGRDSDRRVTGYTWAQDIKTDVLPHHYAVSQCPQCLLADLQENFEQPSHTLKARAVHQVLAQLPEMKKRVLQELRDISAASAELDWRGAVALHLAAIFCTLLPGEREKIDHQKLGRLFLRLSWLFQEMDPQKTREPSGAGSSTTPQNKVFQEIESVQGELNSLMLRLSDLRGLMIENRPETDRSQVTEADSKADMISAVIDKALELQTLLELLHQNVSSGDSPGIDPGSGKNIQAGDIHVFTGLKRWWPQVALEEITCVRSAVDAFSYSFSHEDTDQSIEQGLALVNLIVKLLLKIGDLEAALEQVLQIYKRGFRDRQELQQRLSRGRQEKNMSELDQRNITRKIAFVNSTLSQAAETRKNVLERLFQRDRDRLQALLGSMPDKSIEERKKSLQAAGFHEELVRYLDESGLLGREEKSRGWFGLKKK